MATEISGFSPQNTVPSEAAGIRTDARQAVSDIEKKVTEKQVTTGKEPSLISPEHLEKFQPEVEESPEQDAKPQALSAAELQEILNEINSALYSQNRALKFDIHDATDELVVRVWNTKTDEVIRQYPSEEVLARRAKLLEGDTQSFSTQVS